MLRDRSVSLATKIGALGIGVAVTLLVQALELPAEAMISAGIPGVGLLLALLADGVEWIILPWIVAAAVLSRRKQQVGTRLAVTR